MLEQRIEELTAAVKELTAAIKAGGSPDKAVDIKVKKDKSAPSVTNEAAPKVAAPIVPVPVAETTISKDTLFDKLKEHGAAFGLKTTKALMVKYGADAINVTTASVPAKQYQALYDAAVADLSKSAPKEEVFQ